MEYRNALFFFIIFIIGGCTDVTEQEKFQRPDWVPGKLYQIVASHDSLSLFAECLVRTGFDTIVNTSGAYAIFAPHNDAMEEYLREQGYPDVTGIPLETLTRLIKYHIVQNPFSYKQLQNLGGNGWRESHFKDPYSYAFKRQTILQNSNPTYLIEKDHGIARITSDSTHADAARTIYVESRKYVPVFYDAYLEINGLTPEDYSFYFDREYDRGSVYFGGAKIVRPDLFAENGFVHIVDRVVPPMLNGAELLGRDLPDESYNLFLEMVNWYFPTFEANITATYNQFSVLQGGRIDTLWSLQYDGLAFDIHRELYGETGSIENTIVYHNGMVIPSDKGFGKFVDNTLTAKSGFPHWRDTRSLPRDIVEIIVEPHFMHEPVYPSSQAYMQMFFGTVGSPQQEADIIRKEFGSNCTFIGLGDYTPNPVFTSITGPVFLRPAFSLFRQAMQYIGISEFIAGYEGSLCFFPRSNDAVRADSTLILNWIDMSQNQYYFTELDRNMRMISYLSPGNLAQRIMNHVGMSQPNGSANKEFIRAMGGSYIIWNNGEGTVSGIVPSTVGYNGTETRVLHPEPLDEPASNGKVYAVDYWFNYIGTSMFGVIRNYSRFFNLLRQAGLFNDATATFNFLEQDRSYTVFIPSDQAWDDAQADTLSNERLAEVLKSHFVTNAIIFTDNKMPSGDYTTVNDSVVHINTVADGLEILDGNGDLYLEIEEQAGHNNIFISNGNTVTSVAHEIDLLLVY